VSELASEPSALSEPSVLSARRPIKRALISVYDKAGLLELATGLHALGVEIVSTGSTAQRIADAGVPVTPVEPGDTVETLHERIKIEERRLLVGTVAALAREGATVTGREVTIP